MQPDGQVSEQLIPVQKPARVHSIAFSPDSARLAATINMEGWGGPGCEVGVWEIGPEKLRVLLYALSGTREVFLANAPLARLTVSVFLDQLIGEADSDPT